MATLGLRTRVGYSLGGIATGTYGTVPGLILLPYLTDVIGAPAALGGFIVFLPKAWDLLANPIAGRISDRSMLADRRRPFIVTAGLTISLAFLALFHGPIAPQSVAVAWVLALYLVCATAYAFFMVPYLAMSAEITDDYTERTRLMAWRVSVFTLAILVSGGLAPALTDAWPGRDGYRVMALVMAAMIGLGTLLFWLGTRRAPLAREPGETGPLGAQLAMIAGNRDALALAGCYVLQAVAMGMVLAGVVYVARYVVGDASVATLAFVAFVAPAIVITPLWSLLGRRVGKKRGFVASTVVLMLGLLVLVTARSGSIPVLVGAAALVGVGYAGGQVFPLAMLPDIAAQDAVLSGQNRIGVLSGLWSGVELLGYALGPAVFGIVLTLGGYVSGGVVTQSDSARWAIVLGISVVPAALVVASLVPLSRYRLDLLLRGRAAALAGHP